MKTEPVGTVVMADTDTDTIFAMGSVVTVKTAIGPAVTGEVLAFDQKTRILILKQPASNKKNTQCDIVTLYTSRATDIMVLSEPEPNATPPALPQIDLSSLRKRMDRAVSERRTISAAMNSRATEDARQLYLRLSRFNLNPRWTSDTSIDVMNVVTVLPPYTKESVIITTEESNTKATQTKEYVQKIIEKYYEDKKQQMFEKSQEHPSRPTAASANSEQNQH